MLKIGIVGCGAIGSSLARFITRGLKSRGRLVALFDCDSKKAAQLVVALRLGRRRAVKELSALIRVSDLVIECAHAHSSGAIARQSLAQGKSVMVMSVGGIVHALPALKKCAAAKKARLYIPSGAVAGIDALKSLRIAGLKKVTLITRKHPRSLSGVAYIQEKGIRLEKITADRIIFCGPAREAIRLFPRNINVAAIVSLAGCGVDKTMVKIIASPSIKRNIHEIRVESDAGSMTTRMENILHPANPKTSYLAVLSASSMLHNIVEPVTIGT